jgi:aryl-alcohol dehydrogenase-like predicted oxidoreductase
MSEMTYRALGNSGLVVSAVGLGCNAFGRRMDAQQTRAVVDVALELGITLFDTADSYGLGESERLLGEALGTRRGDVVLATKFGMDMRGANGLDWGARASRRYVRNAVEASLRRLGTDYIDLYQLHQPDLVTPIEETLRALSDLMTQGKINYIGCSNLMAWQLVEAHWVATTSGLQRFVTAQNEYSVYNRTAEAELLPACARIGVSLLPYFPLASGLLTGKYKQGQPAPQGTRLADQSETLADADFDRLGRIDSFARDRGVTMLDVAVGGLLAQPAVGSVIAGATRPEQVRANVAASRWAPSASDQEELAKLGGAAGSGMTHASFVRR